jgi:uncharacterized membrane protein YgcG
MVSAARITDGRGTGAPSKNRIARTALKLFPRILAILLLVGGLAAPAAARALRIHDFHAELDVLPDSSLDVTETIRVEFIGSWQGIYRTIPVEYPGPGGFNYSLFITNVSATDGADGEGASLRVEKNRQRGNLAFRIYVPGATDAVRTVSLHYRVENALRFFPDHDELYWNVTGTDWTVPIEAASAHITLPAGVTGLRAANYTGVYGSRSQDARVESLGSNVDVQTEHPLAYREGLTVVVGWDKGFVQAPSRSEKIAQFLESNWPLFAPLAVFLGMFWLWYARGRDPEEGSIAVQYEPPAGLTPGEVGTLVDDNVDMRDITATIVDLAVRGLLTIEERDEKHLMGLYASKEYVFHLAKKPSEWAGAKPHELLLLAGLFSNGARDQVSLSELQNKFYKNLPGIRTAVYDSLVEHGFYARRPDRVRQVYLSAGFIAGGLLFVIGQHAAQNLGMTATPFLLAALLTAGVVCGFGWFMPARTAAGVRAQHNALGFEDFLGHVEADRMDRMTQTPETFEKYLPFAMALGVEKKWAGAFQGIFTQPPAWYQGPPGAMFHPAGFVYSLDEMSGRAGQAMASAPRSSGSSGFGGGGSSGGGFGGGGGGGF